MKRLCALAAALLLALTGPVAAQELIGSYVAYIGADDLYNSKGARLGQPWQVLRQDRANYHKFGISQVGDEWDPFFGDINNRAAMEQMIMRGTIDRTARANLMRGGATVYVEIYGHGNRGEFINVTVAP